MKETTVKLFSDYAKEIYRKMKDKEGDFADGFLVPEKISIPINKWENFKQRYFPYWLQKIFPVKTKEVNFRKFLIEHSKEEDMKIMKKEKGKCEHDWFEITAHDEKYGKTYKCSKCPGEKFEPNEKEPGKRFGVGKIDR